MKDTIKITDFNNNIIYKPITSYFIETSRTANEKSGGKWLEQLDKDTLSLIQKALEKLRYESEDESNTAYSEDSLDLMATGFLMFCWETHQKSLTVEEFNRHMSIFDVMVSMESLRRKGIINIIGNGMITENNTTTEITPLGELLQQEIEKRRKNV